jgi:2-keto-4-pentenoate hydratase/2-oxohepta-3-ene-1,7-dioic acid hydratase in catechol pathway
MTLFGLDNLPYGVFSPAGGAPRVGVRLGDRVVDLSVLLDDPVFATGSLNAFMAQGRDRWAEVRERITDLLSGDVPDAALHPLGDVRLHLPIEVADYVDFYASEHHASNLGRLFRPDSEPLTPNWKHLPVGYHGRAGTVVVSGTDVVRPCGQRKAPDDAAPTYGPSRRLDIEAELGFVVGVGSPLGSRIGVDEFADHVFGAVLLNDWSARDLQACDLRAGEEPARRLHRAHMGRAGAGHGEGRGAHVPRGRRRGHHLRHRTRRERRPDRVRGGHRSDQAVDSLTSGSRATGGYRLLGRGDVAGGPDGCASRR